MKTLTIRLTLLILLPALLGLGVAARAASDPSTAAQAALEWLLTQQEDSGGFSNPGTTADAVFALVATGVEPESIDQNGLSAIDYLAAQAATYATSSTDNAAKLTLAVLAAGDDPTSFGGQNLISLLQASYNAATGRYGQDTNDHAYAILALAAAGQQIRPQAIAALNQQQLPDGGWSFDIGIQSYSDTNTTALAIQALAAAGQQGSALTNGVAYLKSQQNSDGGFPYSQQSEFGNSSDANSTAYAIQGLLAGGQDPLALKQGQNDPLSALLAFQNPSGSFSYNADFPGDNLLATTQAIPALLGKSFPLDTLQQVYLPLTIR